MGKVIAFAASLAAAFAAFVACGSFESTSTPDADASAPDASASDAPPGPFCKTDGGVFCEDFDDPGSGVLGSADPADGGTSAVVEDPHYSAPNSLRMTFARPPDGDCRYVMRRTGDLDFAAPNGFVAQQKIRSATIVGRQLIGVGVDFENPTGGGICTYYLEVRPDADTLIIEPQGTLSGGTPQGIPLKRKIQAGQWSTVEWNVHGAPGARKVGVTIDGVPALSPDVDVTPLCQATTRITRIVAGLHCVTEEVGADIDVAFDDLRVFTP